jgi:hypothetical protein
MKVFGCLTSAGSAITEPVCSLVSFLASLQATVALPTASMVTPETLIFSLVSS